MIRLRQGKVVEWGMDKGRKVQRVQNVPGDNKLFKIVNTGSNLVGITPRYSSFVEGLKKRRTFRAIFTYLPCYVGSWVWGVCGVSVFL